MLNRSGDGVDRRGFLQCIAWAGTGVVWMMSGGILTSCTADGDGKKKPIAAAKQDFTFVQISDSHIGFSPHPNTNVVGTLREAVRRINAADAAPALLLHTGDLTHLAKPEEFDTVDQIVRTVKTEKSFYVPGEHDFSGEDLRPYLDRYGKGTQGQGWHSFDYKGVHFVGLVNVSKGDTGLGKLGADQLAWLKKDVAGLGDSTAIVVFAHVPLWTVYEKWGWGTEDSAAALLLLRRFGSVTVLNGHIHQVLQKIEGNVMFHTAQSTAFPQPAPGSADSPGPMKNVAAEKLRSMLGLARVECLRGGGTLAVVDSTLE